jgi:peptide deformylase
MPVRPLVRLGDPVLRARACEVSAAELRSSEFQALIDDMIETMRENSGAGLAAPQVGVSLRVAVAQVDKNPRYPTMGPIPLSVWINPIVTVLSNAISVVMYEGCLSVPGLRGRVTRPAHIRLEAQDRTGARSTFEFQGAEAAVVQHELDHLDGVLFVDRAETSTLTYLDEYERFVPPEERLRVAHAK